MILATENFSPQLQLLLDAIDALDAGGFSFWEMIECDEEAELKRVGKLSVQFLDFPEELPVLESEIALLSSVFQEIMLLASVADSDENPT